MSKRRDRERAEKGLLFRNGKLVPKGEVPGNEPEASPEEATEMIEAALRLAGISHSKRRIIKVKKL